MATLPLELEEIIVYEACHSEMPSYIRKSVMITCPLVNRMWKAVFGLIASRDDFIAWLTHTVTWVFDTWKHIEGRDAWKTRAAI
ncbi:uncharacterized protein EV420DRAFT_1643655 [Desarmillaria tabescens]|uniref:Uncharacterized protein n=1 Tax=Armillaria tabescens TaxID=1929756 RepID=A0AA39KD72_ARMTA|nr:uncharacterized protein EV420DRAFT_1643655 [Desarmillaria tabescens]KAK0457800.1 hypothetical protein EV420DRAFT_1643655 [Desarmillaria tabescens]